MIEQLAQTKQMRSQVEIKLASKLHVKSVSGLAKNSKYGSEFRG
jgi:hypothetical protein